MRSLLLTLILAGCSGDVVKSDAGSDTGPFDVGPDSATDSAMIDSATIDSASPDSAMIDSTIPDSAVPDSPPLDAAPGDACFALGSATVTTGVTVTPCEVVDPPAIQHVFDVSIANDQTIYAIVSLGGTTERELLRFVHDASGTTCRYVWDDAFTPTWPVGWEDAQWVSVQVDALGIPFVSAKTTPFSGGSLSWNGFAMLGPTGRSLSSCAGEFDPDLRRIAFVRPAGPIGLLDFDNAPHLLRMSTCSLSSPPAGIDDAVSSLGYVAEGWAAIQDGTLDVVTDEGVRIFESASGAFGEYLGRIHECGALYCSYYDPSSLELWSRVDGASSTRVSATSLFGDLASAAGGEAFDSSPDGMSTVTLRSVDGVDACTSEWSLYRLSF